MSEVKKHPPTENEDAAQSQAVEPRYTFLLAARRKTKCRNTQYLIGSDPLNISKRFESYMGKLRSLDFSSMGVLFITHSVHEGNDD